MRLTKAILTNNQRSSNKASSANLYSGDTTLICISAGGHSFLLSYSTSIEMVLPEAVPEVSLNISLSGRSEHNYGSISTVTQWAD